MGYEVIEHETVSDVRGQVGQVLLDAHEYVKQMRHDRDNQPDISRSSYDNLTGKIRGYTELIDAFTSIGFRIGGE